MLIVKNSEDFYSSIWNCLPQPSFVITSNLKIVEVNSASEVYCETSKSRILNKKITDFINESSLLIKIIRETEKEQRPTFFAAPKTRRLCFHSDVDATEQAHQAQAHQCVARTEYR